MFRKSVSNSELEQERLLIEKAKKNSEAFKPLYEKYFSQIYRYIFNKLRDKELTADLTSQVFLKAMLNIKNFKYQEVPFSAWLYRIATNEVLLFFRKTNQTRFVVVEENLIAELADQSYSIYQDYLEEKLAECIQDLEIEDVQLIELRFQEGKSFKEIGFILNITENNAKVKTYRVLDKLKNKMKKTLLKNEEV